MGTEENRHTKRFRKLIITPFGVLGFALGRSFHTTLAEEGKIHISFAYFRSYFVFLCFFSYDSKAIYCF